MTPEAQWDAFIAQLNKDHPVGRDGHKSFLGSIEWYRQVFLKAQTEEQT